MNDQETPLTAEEVIALLGLEPLPVEGGYFKLAYRASETLSGDVLPARYGGPRLTGTAIYYLLTPDNYSAIHRLPTDELWHFYLIDSIEQLRLHADDTSEVVHLGNDLRAGQRPMTIVVKNTWQSSRLLPGGAFALIGNTLAPGFENSDYETGNSEELIKMYPDATAEILSFF